MNKEEIKAQSRFLIESYRIALFGNLKETPDQFLKRMKPEKEVKKFVIPYLYSTENWYKEVKEIFDLDINNI